MHLVLALIFGAFVIAGLAAIVRGVRLSVGLRDAPMPVGASEDDEIAAARRKALPVLMYVVAVPLMVFGIAGLITILSIAGR